MQSGGVSSKYDDFWAALLPRIHVQLQRAATGGTAAVAVPGLTRLGARRSWYGTAEIRAQKMIFSSGAHATSLSKTVEASGVCQQWPQHVFRFTVAATAGRHPHAALNQPRQDTSSRLAHPRPVQPALSRHCSA